MTAHVKIRHKLTLKVYNRLKRVGETCDVVGHEGIVPTTGFAAPRCHRHSGAPQG
jgi:hypothetical protein